MDNPILKALLSGNNIPPEGEIFFDSTDHVRFQNGSDVSGHNYGCNRRLTIEKNINEGEGYTVTMFNMDGLHPYWQNNVQMAPKQMRIVSVHGNIVELRGYGYDENAIVLGVPIEAASFKNYGLIIMIENNEITRAQLNMFDRNICILYL